MAEPLETRLRLVLYVPHFSIPPWLKLAVFGPPASFLPFFYALSLSPPPL